MVKMVKLILDYREKKIMKKISHLDCEIDIENLIVGDILILRKKERSRLNGINGGYGDFNGKPAEIVGSMKMQKIKEPFPNGESYEQAIKRTHEFYEELKKNHPGKTVLVVGHRATQYGLDTLIDRKTIEECLSVPFKWQLYWVYNFS